MSTIRRPTGYIVECHEPYVFEGRETRCNARQAYPSKREAEAAMKAHDKCFHPKTEAQPLTAETNSGAIISKCGQYRYLLWRVWDESKPYVGWVMLNPSTADATQDDPTIRRCIGFTKAWGYGGIRVANLYAYRAAKPSELWKQDDPYGPDNARYLRMLREGCPLVVAAWGANADPGDARRAVRELAPLFALGLTKHGQPRHPLYVAGGTMPEMLA